MWGLLTRQRWAGPPSLVSAASGWLHRTPVPRLAMAPSTTPHTPHPNPRTTETATEQGTATGRPDQLCHIHSHPTHHASSKIFLRHIGKSADAQRDAAPACPRGDHLGRVRRSHPVHQAEGSPARATGKSVAERDTAPGTSQIRSNDKTQMAEDEK